MTTRPCARCKKNRSERFYVSSRGTVCATCRKQSRSAASHGTRIEALYGITAKEYSALYIAQGEMCAICKGSRKYRLAVDHDHKLERETTSRLSVRGLLCKRCNSLLAKVRDDTRMLDAAIDYLLHPPARSIINLNKKPGK